MVRNNNDEAPQPSRLLPFFLQAADDGLLNNAVMLCEMIGEEIQSISLRVAADSIARWNDAQMTLRPESL